MAIDEKKCGKCGKVKPLKLGFYLQSLAAGGKRYQSTCKECSKLSGWEYQRRKKLSQVPPEKEEKKEKDLLDDYGKAEVRINGKVVMRDGKVLDLKWWKDKLKKNKISIDLT